MTTRLPLLIELGTEELPVKALPGLEWGGFHASRHAGQD